MSKSSVVGKMSVALMVFSVFSATADWTRMNGPCGGDVRSLIAVDGLVFAGINNGGVYVSSDSGRSWKSASVGLTHNRISTMRVFSLAAANGAILAGTLGGGIFRSTDHGVSWDSANSGLKYKAIISLALEGDTVLAGDQIGNIYQSINQGKSWIVIDSGVTKADISALLVNTGKIYAATSGNGVVTSSDRGQTWVKPDTAFATRMLTALAVRENTIFLGIQNYVDKPGGIFRSIDDGLHWARADSGIDSVKDIRALEVSGNAIFAGTTTGIFRSTNKGDTWTRADSGLQQKETYALTAMGTILYAGTMGGVFVSQDQGVSWQKANTGIAGTTVRGLVNNNGTVIAGSENGVFSCDQGTWKDFGRGTTCDMIWGLLQCKGSFFAAVGGYNGGIYLLENDTSTWQRVYTGNRDYRCLALRDSTVFAGSYNQGIVASTDGGKQWMKAESGELPQYSEVLSLLVSGKSIFAGINTTGLFRSDSGIGANWVQQTGAVYRVSIDAFGSCNGVLFASSLYDIYRSSNNGLTWTIDTTDLRNQNFYCFAANGNLIFTGTDSGVYVSGNYGTTWSNVSNGLEGNLIMSLAVGNGTLFAGTYGEGVWQRPLDEMMVAVKEPAKPIIGCPEAFSVITPATPRSSFIVHLSTFRSGRVTLKVFDLSGKQQTCLVDRVLSPGTYTYRWNAGDRAAGCYLLKIRMGKITSTRIISIVQ